MINFIPDTPSFENEQNDSESVNSGSGAQDNFSKIAAKAAYYGTSHSSPLDSPISVSKMKNNQARQRIVKISDSLGINNLQYQFGKTTNNTPTQKDRKQRGSINSMKTLFDDQIWNKFNKMYIGFKQKRKRSQILLRRSGSINDLKFQGKSQKDPQFNRSHTNSSIIFAINQMKNYEPSLSRKSSKKLINTSKTINLYSPEQSQRSYDQNQFQQIDSFKLLPNIDSSRIRIQSFSKNNIQSDCQNQPRSSILQKSKFFQQSKSNKKSQIENSQYAKYYTQQNQELDPQLNNFMMEKYLMQMKKSSSSEMQQGQSGLSLNLQPIDSIQPDSQSQQQLQQQSPPQSPQQVGNQIKFNFGACSSNNSCKFQNYQFQHYHLAEQQQLEETQSNQNCTNILSLKLSKIDNEQNIEDDSASQSGHVTSADTQAGCSDQLHIQHMVNMYKALVYLKNITQPTEEQVAKKRIFLPRLQNPNKKTIVFDLDETLIHCVDNIQKQKPDKILLINIPGSGLKRAGINIRPYTQLALQFAHKHFQVVVFTASHRAYADAVLDYLDPHQEFIDYRLYREHCVQSVDKIYMKDLRVLGNRDLSKVTIIDNHVYSFGFQLDNGIPILPFYDDKNDIELTFLISYFKKLLRAKDCRSVHKKHFEFSELLKYNIENFVKFYDDQGSSDQDIYERPMTMNTMSQNCQSSVRASKINQSRNSNTQEQHINEGELKELSSETGSQFSRDQEEEEEEEDEDGNLEGDAGSGSEARPAVISYSNNNNNRNENDDDCDQEDKSNTPPIKKKNSFSINLFASIPRQKSNEDSQMNITYETNQQQQKDDDLTDFKSPDYLQNQNRNTCFTNTPKNGKHHHHRHLNQSNNNISNFLQYANAFSLSSIGKQQDQEPLQKQRNQAKQNNIKEQQITSIKASHSQDTDNLSRLISQVILNDQTQTKKVFSKSLKSNKYKQKTKKGSRKQSQYQQFYTEKSSDQNIRSNPGSDIISQQDNQNEIQKGMEFISNFFQKNLKSCNEKSTDVTGLPKLSKSSFSSIQSNKAASKRRFSRRDDEDDDNQHSKYVDKLKYQEEDEQNTDEEQITKNLTEERKKAFKSSFGKKQDRRGTQP